MVPHRAVVLLNLGGPDSLDAVRPFLYNLFSDPDIFKFPFGAVTQRLFAAVVSRLRAPQAAKGYAALGGRSPLLEHTQAQAEALARALAEPYAETVRTGEAVRPLPASAPAIDVYVCMRYWHPRARETVQQLKARGYRHVTLLPLYPQYSLTTTGSSYNEFVREARRANYAPDLRLIRAWHGEPDYQRAIIETLRAELRRFPDPDPAHIELLFSAHGLPQKFVDAGDPYEQQVRATYDALRGRLGWPHTTLCYQSRVGPLKWLRPYTEDVIRAKAAAGAKQILVYPIAFVSDHVETLYELGMLYADMARAAGVAHYRVAPALNTHPLFIEALRKLIEHAPNRHGK